MSHRNHAAFIATPRPDDSDSATIQFTEGYDTIFAIDKTIVWDFNHTPCVKLLRREQINRAAKIY